MDATGIRTLRERAGVTRSALADALGLTYMTVYKWETGRTTPSLETLSRALDFLGAGLHELSTSKATPETESP